ncbi:MAG: putative porin [Saprospiraceae bacterium]|nr:putative porin [Saprospiraceae bacterium]
MNRLLGLIFLLIFSSSWSYPDSIRYVVDDSRYFTEDDLYLNDLDLFNLDTSLQYLDTSITTIHHYEMWFREGDIAQDLGAIGSPVKPLYYQAPTQIGRSLGYTGYDPFSFTNSEVKYYDTKRPFSGIDIVMGGNGRQMLNVDFGRNIDERSSFGLDFRRITAIDPIGANPAKDPFSNHYSALLFAQYHTKNHRYYILGNYRWMNHRLFDTGGVKQDSTFDYPSDYFIDVAEPNLLNVESNDRRNNWHIYQQFNLVDSSSSVQLFHSFDRQKQKYIYIDNDPSLNVDYYEAILMDSARTADSSAFETVSNKVGLKGVMNGLSYSIYGLNRLYYYNRSDSVYRNGSENYIGGVVGYKSAKIKAIGSAMLGLNNDYHFFKGEVDVFGGYFNVSNSSYSPTILSMEYFGNHYEWLNDFKNISQTSFEVGFKFKVGEELLLQPFYGMNSINDYIFFAEDSRPYQTTEVINTLYFGLRYDLKRKNYGIRGFYKNYSTNTKLLPVPQNFWHNQVYFKGKMFNRVLDCEFGVDTYFRDEFFGYGYSPVVQQYTVQRSELMWSYWIVDLFFNFKVKNLTIFLKLNHLNQGFTSEGSYLASASYPGQGRAIGFGLHWKLFD